MAWPTMSPEPTPQHAGNQAVTPQTWRRELGDVLLMQERRRKVFPRVALVGLFADAFAVAFRCTLVGGEALRTWLIAWARHYPTWGWLLPICVGAMGAGLAVLKELGLPPSCVLVTLRRGLHESVPTADTRLEAGDRITAVIAPHAAEAVLQLYQGYEAPHGK
jgi:TrkA-C domain